MNAGATEIIALDLHDPRSLHQEMPGFGPFLVKLLHTMEHRQMELELAIASARKIPLRYIHLTSPISVAMWDFSQTEALLQQGYEQAQREIASWKPTRKPGLLPSFRWLIKGQ
jgi:hypothetical protein